MDGHEACSARLPGRVHAFGSQTLDPPTYIVWFVGITMSSLTVAWAGAVSA